MIVSVIASGILLFADIRYAFLIMGVIAVLLILVGTAYGKTRLGLQPEEYTKKDKYE
jgi:hydrogenase/urease accessory protein HupE